MSVDVLFDSLFLVPFLNGILLAVLLSVLGTYSRMRNEWLASLGVAQAAAAGLLFGAIMGGASTLGALSAATAAAVTKTFLGRRSGNDAYAVMLLVGWSAALLLAANSAGGEDLSRALLQGQLYFTGSSQLIAIAVLVPTTVGLMWWLSPRLLLDRLLPDRLASNGKPTIGHDLTFDVLMAVTLALAATAVGVMAAFALVFLPAWVAFRFAASWRAALVWSVGLGLVAYVASFAIAILSDQPYGPVLVATLLVVGSSRAIARD